MAVTYCSCEAQPPAEGLQEPTAVLVSSAAQPPAEGLQEPTAVLVSSAAQPPAEGLQEPTAELVSSAAQPPAKGLQEPTAVLVFKLPDDSEKALEFRCRSLGIGFEKTTPLVVRNLRRGGAAEQLGVQLGWKLKAVNGASVLDMKSEESMELVDVSVSMLKPAAGSPGKREKLYARI